MIFKTREQILDECHRVVEAMYRRGCSTDEIVRGTGLTKIDVLDILQKIYHLDVRKGRVQA